MSNIVYTFENIEVKLNDLIAIQKNQWINDTNVHLAGRKIELEANKDFPDDQKKIMLIPPATIQFFRIFPIDTTKVVTNKFDIFKADIALIPFVDSDSPYDTGSHWSLLVWHTKRSRNEKQIIESLDSHGNYNLIHAHKLVDLLVKLYDINDYQMVVCQVPQQENSYDCGVFVIAFMKHYIKSSTIDGIFDDVSQEKVTEIRKRFQHDYMTK